MIRTRKEKIQDIILILLHPLVYLWMFLDAKITINKTDEVDFKRKEPYLMLANHTFLFDVVHVPMYFKIPPFIVASRTLFTKQPTKFLLNDIAHCIPKSKGSSDTRTARGLISAVKKGYPVVIFPEGNTTFQGNTKYIEHSTFKLAKKLKVDIITCNVKGGYLSKPRWATGKRKNRRVELNYEIAIHKEELPHLSVDEISKIINEKLYNNDYEYQKEKMIKRPGKKLAEGIENILYICPHCNSVNTLESKGNIVRCNTCNTEGFIDEYGSINGFKFNNTVDWDNWQKDKKKILYDAIIDTSGLLKTISFEDDSEKLIGKVDIHYEKGILKLSGAKNLDMVIKDMYNPIITLRRDFSFTYSNVYYYIKLDAFGASLLRLVQDKY